jgi:hypothetical protein
MSQGPENRFRNSLHRKLPEGLHHEKMNNPFRGGTFDDWYSGNKADIWVEYKWGANKLSPLQEKWGRERHAEGRRVFVIIGNTEGGVLYMTPATWEARVGGTQMTKAEIVAWLVGQTMEITTGEESEPAPQRRSKGRGQRIQNHSDRSPHIRTPEV